MATIDSFVEPYKSAPNDLKKTSLRNERGQALEKLFSGKRMDVKDWKGTLRDMRTEAGGQGGANVSVKLLGSSARIVFVNDDKIALESPMYKMLSDLAVGNAVLFSGESSCKFSALLSAFFWQTGAAARVLLG